MQLCQAYDNFSGDGLVKIGADESTWQSPNPSRVAAITTSHTKTLTH